jgi:hypothetical protein
MQVVHQEIEVFGKIGFLFYDFPASSRVRSKINPLLNPKETAYSISYCYHQIRNKKEEMKYRDNRKFKTYTLSSDCIIL